MSHKAAMTAPIACPPDIPGSLAFAGDRGLILCRSGEEPVIVTSRTDATAIAFSTGARKLQFRSGGALHIYDIPNHRDEVVRDNAPYCPEPLPMCSRSRKTPDGRWLLNLKDSARANGMPGPTTLSATNGVVSVRVHADDSDDLDLAELAPGGGTALFWIDPQHSASIMSDTVPLGMIALSSVRSNVTVTLPRTAPPIVALFSINGYPLREWISFAPSGGAFTAITGETRAMYYSEQLVRCKVPQATCEAWNHMPGFVELDPAWSLKGNYVAFVRAKEIHAGDGPSTAAAWNDWNDTRRLFLAATDSKSVPAPVTQAGDDISWPTWITDNRLLFISHDHLREFDLSNGKV